MVVLRPILCYSVVSVCARRVSVGMLMNLPRVWGITGLLVLALVLGGGGTPAPDSSDPFLSYQINKSRGEPRFERRNVFLADRFGGGDFRVIKPVALLNPADARRRRNHGPRDPPDELPGRGGPGLTCQKTS